MIDRALPPDLVARLDEWAAIDPDAGTREALATLRQSAEAGDPAAIAELTSAFAGPLEFGTAGLRGALGPGPARMNRVVVQQAAAGFAAWLRARGQQTARGKVIIGYDARYNSDIFARDTAEIFAGAGFEPLLCAHATPTPVVAFGIKHYGCVAGIVVTASHNPPQDNGYKVYLGDGSQIVPPVDAEIAGHIAKVAERGIASIPRSEAITILADDLVAAYVARAASLVPSSAPRDVAWVYTALHGVGGEVVDRVVEACGFPPPARVAEQQQPDPDFPTVPFPNPEEPGAIDLAMDLARSRGADLVIANDPDADRCAVAIAVDGAWRMLRGDELGVLLGDEALNRDAEGVYACSVVSSTMLSRMAANRGKRFQSTLTGFKWIGRVPHLAYGYEEAIGYCTDPAAVPDKDGITALVRILALAAGLKAGGSTLQDRLDELMRAYGLHTTDQLAVRVTDLGIIRDAMARIRNNPPAALLGQAVCVRDLSQASDHLPPTDAVELTTDAVHVVVRPSGTEPKLKCYIEHRQSVAASQDLVAARAVAVQAIGQVRAEVGAALGLPA